MSDPIKEAQELYIDAINASSDQRRQIEEDLAFSDPSNPEQWDAQIKRQRETDPGGARPCLVFDQLGQYTANVAGQVQKAPPAMHALPVGDGADKRVAEQLDGFFRHIEHTSRAAQHYARALTSAARAGVGYLVLRPEYTNRALNYQEPRISSEGDPLRVVLDPWSVELDGSDANFGYLLTPLSHREFERQFGKKAEKCSFGNPEQRISTDDRESINIAECWKAEDRKTNMIVCLSTTGDEMALSEDDYHAASQRAGMALPVLRTYNDKQRVVRWSRMSGAAALSEETDYPASGIGIIPVYGYVGWSNGRMHYCGIPRRGMNAQRSYNYHMSEMHVFMGQAPKAPWVGAAAAFAGFENLWDRASVDSRAFLPFNHADETGPIPAPQRTPLGANLQNHIAGAQQAIHDIQASLGMYQASLGAPSNESSGIAIESRKQQGEAATAHFPAHLSASVAHIGKLTMEMVPRIIDVKRQVRILGIDESPGVLTIDPGQSQAVQETEQGLSVNPNVGAYDVRVVTGASFSTQRTQAQQAFTEMMRANPAMAPAIAPLWAQTLDIPHADKLAQVFTAIAPPEVRAVLDPDSSKQPKTADLMAKVQQLQAGLQEAIQHAHEAQAEIDQLQAEKAEREEENAIKAYDAQTKRIVGLKDAITPDQVQMLVVQTIERMLSAPDPQMQEPQPDQDAWQMQPLPMAEPLEQEQPEQPPNMEQPQ